MRHNQALDEFDRYSKALLEEAGSEYTNIPQRGRTRTWQQRWRSPQVAFASLGFLVFGNIGMAAAADSAVPGDILYPIDQAYENVMGLFGGDGNRAEERLEEASVLIARGQFDIAMDTIAVAAGEFDTDAGATIAAATTRLVHFDTNVTSREDLHRATFALLTAVRDRVGRDAAVDEVSWRQAIDVRAAAVVDVAHGQPFAPPGQDDTFVPPGQDDGSTPPGLVDKAVPPGQDDGSTPPGLVDKAVPPGQDDGSTPPGLVDKAVPPGQDDALVSPSQDDIPVLPDQDHTFVPPGQDDTFVPPGQDNDSTSPGNGRPRGQGRDK